MPQIIGILSQTSDGQEWLFGFNIKIKNLEIPWKYQYQNQDCWNWQKTFKINIKILEIFFEKFNINIKIFEMSAAESISISRFLKCVKNFKTKNSFIEKVLEISISKSKFLKIPWQSQHQNQDKNSWEIVLIQYQNQDSWELNQSKSRFKIKISKI